MYRILKVREASQRKSLQGLDNIAAGGADGFDAMQKVVDILEESGAKLNGVIRSEIWKTLFEDRVSSTLS